MDHFNKYYCTNLTCIILRAQHDFCTVNISYLIEEIENDVEIYKIQLIPHVLEQIVDDLMVSFYLPWLLIVFIFTCYVKFTSTSTD